MDSIYNSPTLSSFVDDDNYLYNKIRSIIDVQLTAHVSIELIDDSLTFELELKLAAINFVATTMIHKHIHHTSKNNMDINSLHLFTVIGVVSMKI